MSWSATGGGVSDGGATLVCAIMLSAFIRAFFCASRAIFVLSATALPAATRLGFFCFVAGVFEVTCWVVSVCEVVSESAMVFLLNKLFSIEESLNNAH